MRGCFNDTNDNNVYSSTVTSSSPYPGFEGQNNTRDLNSFSVYYNSFQRGKISSPSSSINHHYSNNNDNDNLKNFVNSQTYKTTTTENPFSPTTVSKYLHKNDYNTFYKQPPSQNANIVSTFGNNFNNYQTTTTVKPFFTYTTTTTTATKTKYLGNNNNNNNQSPLGGFINQNSLSRRPGVIIQSNNNVYNNKYVTTTSNNPTLFNRKTVKSTTTIDPRFTIREKYNNNNNKFQTTTTTTLRPFNSNNFNTRQQSSNSNNSRFPSSNLSTSKFSSKVSFSGFTGITSGINNKPLPQNNLVNRAPSKKPLFIINGQIWY